MIEYPDVSHWQGKLRMDGAKAIVAKRTEGTTFADPRYDWYLSEAERLWVPFLGYHYLRKGNPSQQANFAYVRDARPLMLDVEVAADGTFPSVSDTRTFIAQYAALGGKVTLAYIPHWFWRDHWGSPDMRWLYRFSIGLVSSDYSGNPLAGWTPYGGVTPTAHQFGALVPFNGTRLDMNRYDGTADQLADLFLNGLPSPGPQPTPPTTEEDDMKAAILIEENKTCHLWWLGDSGPAHMVIDHIAVLNGLRVALAPIPDVTVTAADVEAGRWGRTYDPTAPAPVPPALASLAVTLTGTATPTDSAG